MHKEQRYRTKARADSFSLFGVDYSLCILKQREVSLGKDNSLLEVANRCSDGVSLIYQAYLDKALNENSPVMSPGQDLTHCKREKKMIDFVQMVRIKQVGNYLSVTNVV